MNSLWTNFCHLPSSQQVHWFHAWWRSSYKQPGSSLFSDIQFIYIHRYNTDLTSMRLINNVQIMNVVWELNLRKHVVYKADVSIYELHNILVGSMQGNWNKYLLCVVLIEEIFLHYYDLIPTRDIVSTRSIMLLVAKVSVAQVWSVWMTERPR